MQQSSARVEFLTCSSRSSDSRRSAASSCRARAWAAHSDLNLASVDVWPVVVLVLVLALEVGVVIDIPTLHHSLGLAPWLALVGLGLGLALELGLLVLAVHRVCSPPPGVVVVRFALSTPFCAPAFVALLVRAALSISYVSFPSSRAFRL